MNSYIYIYIYLFIYLFIYAARNVCMKWMKIPLHPRNYRNMAAYSNDSKLHVLKHAHATKVSCTRLLCIYLREHNQDVFALVYFNPYPTAFPYGNGMVLHFYQQQESSTTKTVHKVINKRLKTYVLSPHTGENFH